MTACTTALSVVTLTSIEDAKHNWKKAEESKSNGHVYTALAIAYITPIVGAIMWIAKNCIELAKKIHNFILGETPSANKIADAGNNSTPSTTAKIEVKETDVTSTPVSKDNKAQPAPRKSISAPASTTGSASSADAALDIAAGSQSAGEAASATDQKAPADTAAVAKDGSAPEPTPALATVASSAAVVISADDKEKQKKLDARIAAFKKANEGSLERVINTLLKISFLQLKVHSALAQKRF